MGKVIIALTICSFLILLVPLISAEKTVKTIDGYLDYIPQTVEDKIYSKIISIDPPDGITNIIDAQIIVKGDFQANTKVYAQIEGYFCSPEYWQVPNLNVPNYFISFDCTELAKNYKGNDFNMSFMTDDIAQNVLGTYKITYYNKPKPEAKIFGTEYYLTDNYGKIFLQLLNDERQIIQNASCYSTIYYPNTTKMVNNSLMAYHENGLYYYDLSVPQTEGVYMISAMCSIPQDVNTTAEHDFEDNDLSGGYGWESDWTGTRCIILSSDTPIDSYHLKVDAQGGGTQYCMRSFNSSGCINGYITFYAKSASLESGDSCHYDYYNGTDYINLLTFVDGQDDDTYRYYSYEYCSAYGTSSDSRIRINATQDGSDNCYIDNIFITVQGQYNETEYIYVRGSGEIHVTGANMSFTGDLNVTAEIDLTEVYENQTKIYNKLDDIIDNLDYITSIISSNNDTVIDLIINVNSSLSDQITQLFNNLANNTNITIDLFGNITQLPKETYLYFDSVEEQLVHNNDYCLPDNSTHRKELLIEKCTAGDCFNITKNIDEICPYGCIDGICNPAPSVKYSMMLIGILGMLGFIFLVYRITGRA